jgi:hypothetical protein
MPLPAMPRHLMLAAADPMALAPAAIPLRPQPTAGMAAPIPPLRRLIAEVEATAPRPRITRAPALPLCNTTQLHLPRITRVVAVVVAVTTQESEPAALRTPRVVIPEDTAANLSSYANRNGRPHGCPFFLSEVRRCCAE